MKQEITREKQQAIIRAAKERFAHYGFGKVTMDEVAGDVDMAKASLYYYFPTKESLFNAVLVQEQEEFIAEMQAILKTDISASRKLIEFTNKRLHIFQSSLNLGTLSFHTFIDTKSVYKKVFEAFEEKELEILNQIISEGKKKGEFSKTIPAKTPLLLIHILQGMRIRTLKRLKDMKLGDDTFKELIEEMNSVLKIFIKGISN